MTDMYGRRKCELCGKWYKIKDEDKHFKDECSSPIIFEGEIYE
jgi:hypothetical protein